MAVLERGRSHYPVSLHGVGLSLGSAIGLDGWHLDQLKHIVQAIEPVRVSDHASFARGVFQGAAVHASDLLPIPFTDEALDVLCRNVDHVQNHLQQQFMVENLSAYLAWRPVSDDGSMTEAEFLSALVRRTGCLLLVDVNNIYVNALNAARMGYVGDAVDPQRVCRAWLDQIPPEAVGEMHLAGHCRVSDAQGDIVIDDHGSRVSDAVWQLYAYAVSRFPQVPTLIEWDTDIPELSVLLEEAEHARQVVPEPSGEALA